MVLFQNRPVSIEKHIVWPENFRCTAELREQQLTGKIAMQVHDEEKRRKILAAAARLFATQPFHKVLLSDVAEGAGVGKGTLYTYFQGKEDLYFSVLHSGFSDLVARLRIQIDEESHSPLDNLEAAVREVVQFAYQAPHHFEVMRTVLGCHANECARWDNERRELKRLIESVIRRGVEEGIFEDPHPELTARFIPGCVRSVMIDRIEYVDASTLTAHILRFVLASIKPREVRP